LLSHVQDWELAMLVVGGDDGIQNLNDLKQVANSVDVIGNNRVIFDIKGNKYRIITVVLVHRPYVNLTKGLNFLVYINVACTIWVALRS
jgi:hypothetical protein